MSVKLCYDSIKALIVSWFIFLLATICKIFIPLEDIRKLELAKVFISDAMIHAKVKLVNVMFGRGVLIKEKLLAMFWCTTHSFLDHIGEILLIIVVVNFNRILKKLGQLLPEWVCDVLSIDTQNLDNYSRPKYNPNGKNNRFFATPVDSPVDEAIPELESVEEVFVTAKGSASRNKNRDINDGNNTNNSTSNNRTRNSTPVPSSTLQLHREQHAQYLQNNTQNIAQNNTQHSSSAHNIRQSRSGDSTANSSVNGDYYHHDIGLTPPQSPMRPKFTDQHRPRGTPRSTTNTTHARATTTTDNINNQYSKTSVLPRFSPDEELNSYQHNKVPSNSNISNSSSGNNCSRVKDWYIFDPIFGVIPSETRDLWRHQEYARVLSRQNTPARKSMDNGDDNVDNKQSGAGGVGRLPPVRYSTKAASNAMKSADTGVDASPTAATAASGEGQGDGSVVITKSTAGEEKYGARATNHSHNVSGSGKKSKTKNKVVPSSFPNM